MPRRAGREPLTRDRIVEVALRLIDDVGLDQLSMRRLGAELGVDPMAVYHHVPNKDALLQAVVQRVFSEMPPPPPEGPWSERVRAWAETYRSVAEAHPNLVLRIVSEPAAVATAAVLANEGLYAALEAAGLPADEVVLAADLIVDYVNGFVLGQAALARAPEEAQQAFQAALDAQPADAVPVQRRLRGAPGTGVGRDSFRFGLDAILAGLAARAGVASAAADGAGGRPGR
ncbi:MAG TPA: TetR/AcrR family transcriptional regulator [Acidimicrobiales bacterium]